MNFTRFFTLGIISAFSTSTLFLLIKGFLSFPNLLGNYIFWVLTALVLTACVRRLGVITFLEAFFVAGIWLFFRALLDILLTAQVVGGMIFKQPDLYLGYITLVLSVILFHKKRHVYVRKQQKH